MNNKVICQAYENEYVIKRTKPRSWLNVFIINVGICLAVSLGMLLTKLLGAEEVVDTFIKGMV